MTVLSSSSKENWVHGAAHISHTYSTPNNAGAAPLSFPPPPLTPTSGQPWLVSFRGCCRLAALNTQTDSDATFALNAAVDLLLAPASSTLADLLMLHVV